jgi:hypothetical protein
LPAFFFISMMANKLCFVFPYCLVIYSSFISMMANITPLSSSFLKEITPLSVERKLLFSNCSFFHTYFLKKWALYYPIDNMHFI